MLQVTMSLRASSSNQTCRSCDLHNKSYYYSMAYCHVSNGDDMVLMSVRELLGARVRLIGRCLHGITATLTGHRSYRRPTRLCETFLRDLQLDVVCSRSVVISVCILYGVDCYGINAVLV